MKTVIKVENYKLKTIGGRHIRIATKVIFSDNTEIRFLDKMTKREAIKNAEYQCAK